MEFPAQYPDPEDAARELSERLREVDDNIATNLGPDRIEESRLRLLAKAGIGEPPAPAPGVARLDEMFNTPPSDNRSN